MKKFYGEKFKLENGWKKLVSVGKKIRSQKIDVKNSGWKIDGKNWTGR